MLEQTSDNLLLTTVYLSRLLTKHAKERGLRVTAFSVLNNLEHWGERSASGGLTQKQLADMEDVRQATMSTLVADLQAQGLVSCGRDEHDGRTVNVRLTSKGKQHLAREGHLMRSMMADLLTALDAEQLAVLSNAQSLLADLCLNSDAVQGKVTGKGG